MNINPLKKTNSGKTAFKVILLSVLICMQVPMLTAQTVSADLPDQFPDQFEQYSFLQYEDENPYLVVEKDNLLQYLQCTGSRWQYIEPAFQSVFIGQQLEMIEVVQADNRPLLLIKSNNASQNIYILSINKENELFLVSDGPVNGLSGEISSISIYRTQIDDIVLMYIFDGNLVYHLYDPESGDMSETVLTNSGDVCSYDIINAGKTITSDEARIAVVSPEGNQYSVDVCFLDITDGSIKTVNAGSSLNCPDNFFLLSGIFDSGMLLVFSDDTTIYCRKIDDTVSSSVVNICPFYTIEYLMPAGFDENKWSFLVKGNNQLIRYEYSLLDNSATPETLSGIKKDSMPVIFPLSSTTVNLLYQNESGEYRIVSGLFSSEVIHSDSDMFSDIEYKDDGFIDIHNIPPLIFQLEYNDDITTVSVYGYDTQTGKAICVMDTEIDSILSEPVIAANTRSKLYFFTSDCLIADSKSGEIKHFKNVVMPLPTEQKQSWLLSKNNQNITVMTVEEGAE